MKTIHGVSAWVLTVLLAALGAAHADSIRVDGTLYENVKVLESSSRYYFKAPGDDSKTISVPKTDVKPEDIQYDAESLELRAMREKAAQEDAGKEPRRRMSLMPDVPSLNLPPPPPISAPAQTQAAAAPEGFAHYEDAAGGISLDYPKNWFVADMAKLAAGAAAQSPYADMLKAVAIMSRKEALDKLANITPDFSNPAAMADMIDAEGASVSVVRINMQAMGMDPAAMGMSPMQMLSMPGLAEQFGMVLKNAQIVSGPSPATVAGRSGASLVARGDNSAGVSLTLTITLLTDTGGMATVQATYPTAREGEFKPALTTLINSIRFS